MHASENTSQLVLASWRFAVAQNKVDMLRRRAPRAGREPSRLRET